MDGLQGLKIKSYANSSIKLHNVTTIIDTCHPKVYKMYMNYWVLTYHLFEKFISFILKGTLTIEKRLKYNFKLKMFPD